jgi:hypothetical protein
MVQGMVPTTQPLRRANQPAKSRSVGAPSRRSTSRPTQRQGAHSTVGRVGGSRFRVHSSGFRVQDSELRAQSDGFIMLGLGFRDWGSEPMADW